MWDGFAKICSAFFSFLFPPSSVSNVVVISLTQAFAVVFALVAASFLFEVYIYATEGITNGTTNVRVAADRGLN